MPRERTPGDVDELLAVLRRHRVATYEADGLKVSFHELAFDAGDEDEGPAPEKGRRRNRTPPCRRQEEED